MNPDADSTFAPFDNILFPLADGDRNAHPSSTGLLGSGGSLRKAVGASGCGLCGDCKYIYPQRKTLGKQGGGGCRAGREHPPVGVKGKKGIAVSETPKKIIIWIDPYPMVTLCDVAKKLDSLSHARGYVLPELLKTTVVHCFNREMRTGVRCFERRRRKSEESPPPCNGEFSSPAVQLEKTVRRPRSPAERRGRSRESADVLASSGRFLKGWTSESSATCSASLSLGERTKKGVECRAGMWDKGVEEEEEEEEATHRKHKRMKLGDRVKDVILPSAPGFESNGCKDPARSDSKGKGKPRRLTAADGPSCAERAGAGGDSLGGAAKKKRVSKKARREIENVAESDAATPPAAKVSRARGETDAEELESCTCQRVRAYSRKIKITCARTYMSWPFSNIGVSRRVHAGTAGSPERPPDPSTGEIGDSPSARTQPGSSSERSDDQMLPAAPSARQLPRRIEERRDQDGEGVSGERNGKSPAHAKFASHFEEAAASPADLHSDASPALSVPSRCGISRVASSRRRVNGYGADSYAFSTPSPSALGLSDCETAANSSPVSSPFGRDGPSGLPATPSSLPPSSFPPRRVGGVESARSASSPLTSFAATSAGDAADEALFRCEEAQRTSWASSSDSDSCDFSLLLPQHDHRSAPSDTRPFNHAEGLLHSIPTERGVQKDSNEFLLPLMLSPVTSPQGPPGTRPLPHRPHCSGKGEEEEEEEDEKEMNKDAREHQVLPGRDVQHIDGDHEHGSEEQGVCESSLWEPRSSSSSGSDEDDVEQGNAISDQVSPDPQTESPRTSGALAEPCSSPSSDEHDFGAEGTGPSDTACGDGDETRPEAAADPQRSFLDEFTAYNQDILLVDVVQDDPELYVNPPRGKLLELRRARVPEASEARHVGAVKTPSSPRTDGASLALRRRWGSVDLMASPQNGCVAYCK